MKNNPVVLITGASSGIGKALALRYAKAGYYLLLAARNESSLKEVQQLCEGQGVKAAFLQTDVSVEEDCKKLLQYCEAQFGRLDVLINNAGISMRALFSEMSLSVFKKVMEVNFNGCLYCTHYAMPLLLASKGSIIGVSSIAGYRGLPARTAYSASKFAMNGFLEALRSELLNTGVHVLTAAPGFTASNIRNVALDKDGNKQQESPRDEKKMMSAAEVADAIFEAQQSKRKTLVLTTEGRLSVWLNKWMSGTMDKVVFNHLAKEPDSPLK